MTYPPICPEGRANLRAVTLSYPTPNDGGPSVVPVLQHHLLALLDQLDAAEAELAQALRCRDGRHQEAVRHEDVAKNRFELKCPACGAWRGSGILDMDKYRASDAYKREQVAARRYNYCDGSCPECCDDYDDDFDDDDDEDEDE